MIQWYASIDMYIYWSIGGDLICDACILNGSFRAHEENYQEFLDHVREHKEAGHRVPKDIEQRIQDAIEG